MGSKRIRSGQERANEGLRMVLTAIPKSTRGDAAKVLATPYVFQCPPMEEISIPKAFTFHQYTNFKGDEYLQRGGRTLTRFTMRTLVVEYGRFVVNRNFDVETLVGDLERLVQAGYPMDFMASHTYNENPEYHGAVVIESVTRVEQVGEADTRYLDLSFVEWPDAKVRARSSKAGATSQFPFTITVRSKQIFDLPSFAKKKAKKPSSTWTLAQLSKWVYGSTKYAVGIAEAQAVPIRGFGMHTPLVQYPGFKKGGKVVFPEFAASLEDGGVTWASETGGVNQRYTTAAKFNGYT